jgi:hypothetical protein
MPHAAEIGRLHFDEQLLKELLDLFRRTQIRWDETWLDGIMSNFLGMIEVGPGIGSCLEFQSMRLETNIAEASCA